MSYQTYHLVGVHVTAWQPGDQRTRQFWEGEDNDGDEPNTLNDRIWVVDGEVLPVGKRNIDKVTDLLIQAMSRPTEEPVPGTNRTWMVYKVLKDVLCFKFRFLGTGSFSHEWGDLDRKSEWEGLFDVVEHEMSNLIRVAKRKFEADKDDEGKYFNSWFTFVTFWTHTQLNEDDEEWFFQGVVQMPKLWNTLEQLPGDTCAKCKGWGNCECCVAGIVQPAETSQ